MTSLSDSSPDRWLNRLDPHRLFERLRQRRTRLAAAWGVAVAATVIASLLAWYNCRDAKRGDGNWGHKNIDFSGQWLLAAMFASGEWTHLYDRWYQKPLLQKAFPRDLGNPAEEKSDADQILEWVVHDNKNKSTLSGPMYPPVSGMLFAPLGALPPQPAYRLMQLINLVLTFVAAWLVERLTGGRVWMPVTVVILFLYPGHAGGFHLGQNPQVTLTLLLLGWYLLREGRPGLGGVVWGFLAFKPVWALAFLLVPLLTRRWRFASAMALTGAALAAATLPFTGLQPWLDWLKIGGIGSEWYAAVRNWVFLSRDLISIPRRWLLTFNEDGWANESQPYGALATALGVSLWASVPLATALVAWRKRREPAPMDGPGAAFVLLAAYFSCYHFMYYDALLTVLPLALLFTRPQWYLEQAWAHPWRLLPLVVLAVLLMAPPVATLFDSSCLFPPYDTFALLALWAWCGWQWTRNAAWTAAAEEPPRLATALQ
jgi:hypothetical protein